jgi:hypothetical protein
MNKYCVGIITIYHLLNDNTMRSIFLSPLKNLGGKKGENGQKKVP